MAEQKELLGSGFPKEAMLKLSSQKIYLKIISQLQKSCKNKNNASKKCIFFSDPFKSKLRTSWPSPLNTSVCISQE